MPILFQEPIQLPQISAAEAIVIVQYNLDRIRGRDERKGCREHRSRLEAHLEGRRSVVSQHRDWIHAIEARGNVTTFTAKLEQPTELLNPPIVRSRALFPYQQHDHRPAGTKPKPVLRSLCLSGSSGFKTDNAGLIACFCEVEDEMTRRG
jgi:hypothetical protein